MDLFRQPTFKMMASIITRKTGALFRRDRQSEASACSQEEGMNRQWAKRDPSINQDTLRALSYFNVIGEVPPPKYPPVVQPRKSQLCKQADFSLDAYRYWMAALKQRSHFHRKLWEFFHICQALYERSMLRPGKTGLGFGVGKEPLPALFASLGCKIVATDQPLETAMAWQKGGQHADSLSALERPDICPLLEFRNSVSFEIADMNDIPPHFENRFDFCWSACCLEHLGTIERGIRFIENSLHTLKTGGVAVHTTDFNLSSDDQTLESPDLSIFRKQDVETVIARLEAAGHHVEPLDLDRGTALIDNYVDLPPFSMAPHLRIRIADFDCTSIGLIITRLQ